MEYIGDTMSHITFESLKSVAIGRMMDVIIREYAITSAMASSRLKETHYQIIVTNLAQDRSKSHTTQYSTKKEIKSIEHVGKFYRVVFIDNSKLEHLLTGEELLVSIS